MQAQFARKLLLISSVAYMILAMRTIRVHRLAVPCVLTNIMYCFVDLRKDPTMPRISRCFLGRTTLILNFIPSINTVMPTSSLPNHYKRTFNHATSLLDSSHRYWLCSTIIQVPTLRRRNLYPRNILEPLIPERATKSGSLTSTHQTTISGSLETTRRSNTSRWRTLSDMLGRIVHRQRTNKTRL